MKEMSLERKVSGSDAFNKFACFLWGWEFDDQSNSHPYKFRFPVPR